MPKRLAEDAPAPTPTPAAASGHVPDAYVPKFSTTSVGATRPFLEESRPFVFVFDPNRWTVIEGLVVPSLIKPVLEAGVNRVAVRRDGTFHLAAFRASLEEQNRVLIPYAWGPGGGSYMRRIETQPHGGREVRFAHITAWEAAGRGDTRTYPDTEAYAKWLRGLIDSGKLPDIEPHKAQVMFEKRQTRYAQEMARAEAGGQGAGPARIRAKQIAAELEALEKAATRRGEPVAGEAATVNLED